MDTILDICVAIGHYVSKRGVIKTEFDNIGTAFVNVADDGTRTISLKWNKDIPYDYRQVQIPDNREDSGVRSVTRKLPADMVLFQRDVEKPATKPTKAKANGKQKVAQDQVPF